MALLIGCSPESEQSVEAETSLEQLKSITTRFISHQNDTQGKDGKIVSVASFLPDGSLEKFTTQTTYPYDRQYPEKKHFWQTPNKSRLAYIMDGLSLDEAENNFLYGHQWPAVYARYVQENNDEGTSDFGWKETIRVDNPSQPSYIERKRYLRDDQVNAQGGIKELFLYEGNKVSAMEKVHFLPEAARKAQLQHIEEKLTTVKDVKEKRQLQVIKTRLESESIPSNPTIDDVLFKYEGELLQEVILDNRKRHRFYYEGGQLIRSEFLVNGKVFNTRIHHYENGLKQKTEILNVNADPEFTILYEYEFW
jgi:antitoxin component YwqK of YwqJK toxin-antitoxin module